MRTGVELCIQKRLRNKCLSKEEVQQQTGISSERLEQLEKGKVKPTYKEIGLLTECFSLFMLYIFLLGALWFIRYS